MTPREVADVTAFVASPCADAITGSDFIIDGGLGITGFKRQPSQPPKSGAQQDAGAHSARSEQDQRAKR
jgi:hypothetical protein